MNKNLYDDWHIRYDLEEEHNRVYHQLIETLSDRTPATAQRELQNQLWAIKNRLDELDEQEAIAKERARARKKYKGLRDWLTI